MISTEFEDVTFVPKSVPSLGVTVMVQMSPIEVAP